MEWWETLLLSAATCLITLVVTYIFNVVTNHPKKKKEEEKEWREQIMARIDKIEETINNNNQLTKDQSAAIQAILKDALKDKYIKYLDKGYAPIDVKEDLERMYKCYHNLGANGTMDDLRNRFMKLPINEEEDKDSKK